MTAAVSPLVACSLFVALAVCRFVSLSPSCNWIANCRPSSTASNQARILIRKCNAGTLKRGLGLFAAARWRGCHLEQSLLQFVADILCVFYGIWGLSFIVFALLCSCLATGTLCAESTLTSYSWLGVRWLMRYMRLLNIHSLTLDPLSYSSSKRQPSTCHLDYAGNENKQKKIKKGFWKNVSANKHNLWQNKFFHINNFGKIFQIFCESILNLENKINKLKNKYIFVYIYCVYIHTHHKYKRLYV